MTAEGKTQRRACDMAVKPDADKTYLSRQEAAWLLGVSPKTLAIWADRGAGPHYFLMTGGGQGGQRTFTTRNKKTGRVETTVRRTGIARYRRSEVERWIEEQERRASDGE